MDKAKVKEAMEAALKVLGEIQVPVALNETITRPILIAAHDIRVGLQALETEEETKQEEAEESSKDE